MRERMKRLVRGLNQAILPALLVVSVLTSAVGLSSLSSALVHAADGAPITGIAGKCLDLQGGVTQNGNKVQLYTCNSSAAQNWQPNADGTIRNQGKCLDVQLGGTDPGSLVQLFDCNGTNAQKWQIQSDGSIVNVNGIANLCLDSQLGGTADRTQIQIYTCNSTNAQHWTVSAAAAAAPASSTPAVTTPAPASVTTPTPAPTPSTNTGDGYTNVDDNYVNSPSSNPAGATAQCKDGTYSYSQHHSGTCSYHGGVAAWL